MNPATPSARAGPAVVLAGLHKGFFGVPVLRDVSFTLAAGRITGLVGENGAGKSTLMNLLGGVLPADAGSMAVGGRPHRPRDPDDARRAGIAFVHQELNLFPNLSIAENLHLADFPTRGLPWIDRAALRSRTRELLRQVGLERSPDTLVERLPPGECQLVEIARALGANARVLILDEPTSSLSPRECARLLDLLGQLRRRGLAIVYISHALGDVLRLCDDLVVLRDGEVVAQGPAAGFTLDQLVAHMVGRPLEQLFPVRAGRPARPAGDSGPVLSVRAVSQPGMVRDITFDLDPGEIVGLFGLLGAGRTELARILFGLDPHATGEIRLDGRPLAGPPRARVGRGMAFLTEDRRHEGLCLDASVADNLTLVTLPAHGRTPLRWLDSSTLREAVSRIRTAVRLSPGAGDSQPVRTLSGGNQQKVVLGKWLLARPRVLLLDEPTRGIDVGAKFEIYQLIQRHADDGAGVLFISSEIEELTGLCDRILVLRHGMIGGGFARADFDRERILAAALHDSRT